MKNRRAILVLLMLIAACVAALLALDRGGVDAKTSRRVTLIDPQADVVGVSLSRKNAQTTVLVRELRGWRLLAPYAGSADERVVMKLVDALSQTQVSDVISEADLLKLGRTRADFALDNPVLAVELTDETGARETCSFGALTPTADGVYAMVDGLGAVFVLPTNVLASVAVSADGFRRRSVFPAGAEFVSGFEIKREGRQVLEFVREGESWRVDGTEASFQKISRIIADLTSANAVSFVWPVGATNESAHATGSLLAGYGLEPDSAVTVTLNGMDGVARRVSFGKTAGDGLVYALVQNGGAIVTLPAGLRDMVCQDAVMFADSRLFQEDIRSVVFFSVMTEDGLYSFSRDAEGTWSLESPVSAAADKQSVESMLSRILSLSPSDVVGAGGVSVSVSTNAPKVRVSRDRVLGKGAFEDLRSHEMVRIDPALVRRIVRTSGEAGAKPVAVVYDRDRRAWNLENGAEGLSVRTEGIESVLSAVNPLTARRVEKLNVATADLERYGLDEPFLTIAVDQDSDTAVRRNVLIGRKTGDGRYATIGSADAIFVLSNEAVRRLSAPIVAK